MKSISTQIAAAMFLVTALAGCASETTSSDSFGSVAVNLIVGSTDVTSVSFEVTCDGLTLNGEFNVNDEQEPPVWAAIMDLPPGDCSVALTAFDDAGAPLCTGSADFVVVVDQTVKVNVVLTCIVGGVDPLGNVDIDATFEIVEGNSCPRLHFLNVVPDEVPPEGSAVTVLVSDPDGDPVSTALTATGGIFGDPFAQSTTYTCDGAQGTQTVSVVASDGDAACDKIKSFDVTCPGVDPCEGVTCDDTGNECTSAACVDGVCVTSNVANGTTCSTGGGELTTNGGFETGNLDGWTQFCDGPNNGTCAATTAQANGGSWSGNVATAGAPANPLIKQANIGIGTAQPNSSCDISFDLYGVAGEGGIVFAEFFSELSGGGTSSNEILSGGPLFPSTTWTTYSFTATTGPDVSGGVTLQLAAVCGAVPGCAVDAYFDNVSVTCGSGGGAGTCQEGVCEPSDLCIGVDCNDNNECTIDACNPADGSCSSTPDTGASCDGGAGTCDAAGMCQPNDLCIGVDCNDNNECTVDACNPANGSCSNTPDTGASCDGGAGTCDAAGVCQANATCEYTQDFELLTPAPQDQPTSLADDGWLVGANVFQAADGAFAYNYFAFPAPNGGAAFSAVVVGEGGAPQGAQQMSIYNDYNNADHGNGFIIEAIVFRERLVVAADVGTTISFTFDAKAGNINDPSGSTVAEAFIKTLDPSDGFSTSASGTQDTTNLPDTWGTFTVSILIPDNSFIGHVLQFGAQSRATNFEPSGIFYDNMAVCSQ